MKIAGEQEVKAEVRLRFRNAQKQKLVLTRKLQVTKKKTAGLTMKTLEGTLTFAGDKDDDKSVGHPSSVAAVAYKVVLST